MKRTVTILLLIAACWHNLCAQNTVESIRQRYAGIKDDITEMMKEDGFPPVYYEVKVVQNLPGTGPHHEITKMFYDERDDDEVYPSHYLTFATLKYNFAAREYYEEYLFDDDGKIAFIYARTPEADEDTSTMHELRFYFSNGKPFRTIVKKAMVDSEDFKTEFTGNKTPKAYEDLYSQYIMTSDRIKKLFEATEASTHI